MFAKKLTIAALATATLSLGAITSQAQDAGALLDLLVKKRVKGDSPAETSVRAILNSRKLLFGEILIVKAQKG